MNRNFAAIAAVIVLSVVSPAHAYKLSQIANDCKARFPEETTQGLANRIRCAANHPLAYQADAMQRAEAEYSVNVILPKLERDELTLEQAHAYLDQHWEWTAQKLENERKRQMAIARSRMDAERWGEVARNAENYNLLYPNGPPAENMYRPAYNPNANRSILCTTTSIGTHCQ